MSKLRIGFVGVGNMGQAAHLRNYVTLPDCEGVALAEIRPRLAQEVARRYGVPKVYSNHTEMLELEKLDGIVAIQQFQNHITLIPDLLKAGVPVLTEKPLADTLENGEALLHAARGAAAPLYLAYHKRSDPATAYTKATIERWKATGELGKMRYVRISMPPGDWAREGFASNVHTDESYDSIQVKWDPYMVFVNYYIHQVNLMRFLLGEDYEVVFADPGSITLATRSESGVSGIIEMASFESSRDWQESALVTFQKGWIRLDLPAPLALDEPGRVTIFEDPGQPVEPTLLSPSLPHFHAMRSQAQSFLKAIRGESHPLCGVEDAYKDLQTARSYVDLFQQRTAP